MTMHLMSRIWDHVSPVHQWAVPNGLFASHIPFDKRRIFVSSPIIDPFM